MKKITFILVVLILVNTIFLGCGVMPPAQKPNTGPTGAAKETTPKPPFLERFQTPPSQLYELEDLAGIIFEGINKENWQQAKAGLDNLNSSWMQVKEAAGDKKGVKGADEALLKLNNSIADKKVTNSYTDLNAFMGGLIDIGKSYKLSPLSDIIAISNAMRNVAFYTEDKNWTKAAAKVKELEDTWEQLKPSLEQIGILGEVTKSHSLVKRLKDAINAENKPAAEQHLSDLNSSMSRIINFYRGK